MHKRWAAVVVLVLVFGWGSRASSQDNYEERIASLETRVGRLESVAGMLGAGGALPGQTLYGTVSFGGMAFSQVYLTEVTCYGVGEYADLVPGAAVVAVDETQAVVRSGVLKPGAAPPKKSDGSMALMTRCSMPFQIDGLTEAEGYRITFGADRYVDLSWETLVSQAFTVEITA